MSDRRPRHFFPFFPFYYPSTSFFLFLLTGALQSSKVLGRARCRSASQVRWLKNVPCKLSRRIASNLQACPTWPQGLPAAHCHDGQLQQLINYAEAINALGKHSSDVLLLSISHSPPSTTFNSPHPLPPSHTHF